MRASRTPRTLTLRELNRATLARQLLLHRAKLNVVTGVERLAALQAQWSPSPYFALWSRLAEFRRERLWSAPERHTIVRARLMRGTLHLVSARDFYAYAVATQDRPRVAWNRIQVTRGADPERVAALAAAASPDARGARAQAPHLQGRGRSHAVRPAHGTAAGGGDARAGALSPALRRGAHRLSEPRAHRELQVPLGALRQERHHRSRSPHRRDGRRDLVDRASEGPGRARDPSTHAHRPERSGRRDHRRRASGAVRGARGALVRGPLPMSDVRAILHCDLDAFYASVEQRDHPEYRGKPVIVGGAPGERGVVMAASYEARAFGVRSAMPLRTAALLCPDAIFVPGDRDAYVTASEQVMALFRERTPLVEPISLDEAFLDVTATEHLFGDRESMARAIKREVRERCGLVISVGVATNKLCAKIGSDLRKPDGLVVVAPGGEAAFLAPLAIERLWGVGVRTRELLAGWGITTIGALAAFDREALETRLGEFGVAIWERAHGIDDGSVTPSEDYVPKSVGHSHTFFENTLDTRTIESTLLRLSEGVGQRLRDQALLGRTITLTLRVAPFETRTRQRTLADATNDDQRIFHVARDLLREALA